MKTEEYGEAHYYIYAFSAEYDLDVAEELVEQAQEEGIHIYAEMGSIYTCKVWYNYNTDGKAYWNALDAEGRISEEFEDITNIDKEEILCVMYGIFFLEWTITAGIAKISWVR